MSPYLLLCALLHFSHSQPTDPTWARDEKAPPGTDAAVPHHTTSNSFLGRQMKNLLQRAFGKEESTHTESFTNIYVMNQHMYYTYTHEFTPYNGPTETVADHNGNYITEDPILRDYAKDKKDAYREELLNAIKNKNDNLDKGTRTPAPWVNEPVSAENAKSNSDEGLFKSALRNIPFVNRFVREAPNEDFGEVLIRHRRQNKDDGMKKMFAGMQDMLKENLKGGVQRVLGKSHSKISHNIKNELLKVGGNLTQALGRVGHNVKDAVVHATVKLVDGVKTVVQIVGRKVGEVVLTEKVRSLPWKEIRGNISENMKRVMLRLPILSDFVPEPSGRESHK